MILIGPSNQFGQLIVDTLDQLSTGLAFKLHLARNGTRKLLTQITGGVIHTLFCIIAYLVELSHHDRLVVLYAVIEAFRGMNRRIQLGHKFIFAADKQIVIIIVGLMQFLHFKMQFRIFILQILNFRFELIAKGVHVSKDLINRTVCAV